MELREEMVHQEHQAQVEQAEHQVQVVLQVLQVQVVLQVLQVHLEQVDLLVLAGQVEHQALVVAQVLQEQARQSSKGTAAALKEQIDNQNRAKNLSAQAALAYAQASTATGQTRDNLLKQSENLVRAASEAEDLARIYGQIAAEAAKLDSSTTFFRTASSFVSSIPGFSAFATPFKEAEEAARKAVVNTGSTLAGFGAGLKSLGKSLFDLLSIPALIAGTLQLSKSTKELSTNLGVSLATSRNIVREFDRFALSTEDSRITTQKLLEAQNTLTNQLGISVQFSGETLKNFILLTEYIGVSAESAAKLTMISEGLGVSSRQFTDNLAESVTVAGQALGVNIPLKEAFDTVGKLSATTLVNLQRNPQAIAQAVVESKRLGLSFQEIQSTTSKLLDFESSIASELEAELLTGRQLNLERARAAALRGDEVSLARELRSQVGSLSQFEKLNVIQRESDKKKPVLKEQEAGKPVAGDQKESGRIPTRFQPDDDYDNWFPWETY